jgi:hypothetical protein
MLRTLPLAAAACLLFACNNVTKTTTTSTDSTTAMQNDSTNANMQDGWQPLFDGKTTAGWHNYGKTTIGSAWKVADGVLFLDASQKDNWQIQDGGDIVTDQDFDNFHLKLQWKIDTGGNSGIMFYVHEDTVKYKYPWNTGPEMQVLDNEKHADAKIPKHHAGDLYDLIASTPETVKPAGEWNDAEIIADHGNLTFRLNGADVVKTTMWDDSWKQMIAGSKFKEYPDFGTYKSGKIALQDHGNNVWFRNIMIKEL